jgi:hypothetical protein
LMDHGARVILCSHLVYAWRLPDFHSLKI